MQKVILNNGVEMLILGYGAFLINYEKVCEQCVYQKNKLLAKNSY
jgi:Aldo/keto reductases, related to diketogulonate reductase